MGAVSRRAPLKCKLDPPVHWGARTRHQKKKKSSRGARTVHSIRKIVKVARTIFAPYFRYRKKHFDYASTPHLFFGALLHSAGKKLDSGVHRENIFDAQKLRIIFLWLHETCIKCGLKVCFTASGKVKTFARFLCFCCLTLGNGKKRKKKKGGATIFKKYFPCLCAL